RAAGRPVSSHRLCLHFRRVLPLSRAVPADLAPDVEPECEAGRRGIPRLRRQADTVYREANRIRLVAVVRVGVRVAWIVRPATVGVVHMRDAGRVAPPVVVVRYVLVRDADDGPLAVLP